MPKEEMLHPFSMSLGNLVIGFDPATKGSERHVVVTARRTAHGLEIIDVEETNPYVRGIVRVRTP